MWLPVHDQREHQGLVLLRRYAPLTLPLAPPLPLPLASPNPNPNQANGWLTDAEVTAAMKEYKEMHEKGWAVDASKF